MLGFTAFLQSRRRLVKIISGLLVGFEGGRLWGVREDEVDEDGGEEEEAAHDREWEGEPSDLVKSSTNHGSHNLPWEREVFTCLTNFRVFQRNTFSRKSKVQPTKH